MLPNHLWEMLQICTSLMGGSCAVPWETLIACASCFFLLSFNFFYTPKYVNKILLKTITQYSDSCDLKKEEISYKKGTFIFLIMWSDDGHLNPVSNVVRTHLTRYTIKDPDKIIQWYNPNQIFQHWHSCERGM